MENEKFRVAGQTVKVVLPDGVMWEQLLPSFIGFESDGREKEQPICTLGVSTDKIVVNLSAAVLLTEVSQVLGEYFRLYEMDDSYVIDLHLSKTGECYRMVSNTCFAKACAYIGPSGQLSGEALNIFLMILFAQSCVLHRTFLVHASVVMKGGKGYAFLGKSGTGKSTHSRLWLQYIEDTELLNDDNPAIGIAEDGKVYVYGTPWSGKTPCYRNRRAELSALVRLEQAAENRFLWKNGADALIALIPSCSSMRWNDQLFIALGDLLEDMIQKISIGHLQCLPDEAAVLLCYDEIIKK